jgi:hypothetical protein
VQLVGALSPAAATIRSWSTVPSAKPVHESTEKSKVNSKRRTKVKLKVKDIARISRQCQVF